MKDTKEIHLYLRLLGLQGGTANFFWSRGSASRRFIRRETFIIFCCFCKQALHVIQCNSIGFGTNSGLLCFPVGKKAPELQLNDTNVLIILGPVIFLVNKK